MTYQITEGLTTADAVVQAFAYASEDFDADIFAAYLKAYPHHGERLKSYAQVWLMSRPASAREIAETTVPEDRMLTAQSRLLMAWERSFADSGAVDIAAAAKEFEQFSGDKGLNDFAQILLDATDDAAIELAAEYLDLGLNKVPRRRELRIAHRTGLPVEHVPLAMASYRHQAQAHVFHSAKDKPAIPPIRSWEDAVRSLDVGDDRKRELLTDD